MSRYQKFNRYERAQQRQQMIETKLHGEGLYVFKNNTKGELLLPKATPTGQRRVPIGGEFQGDSYFISLVRNNMLTLIREVTSIQQDRSNKKEAIMTEQKLLLEQPERVTIAGKTEHVLADKKDRLTEEKKDAPAKTILLNEGPAAMTGIEIIS